MFNEGFLIRANITVLDHRVPEHGPHLPRKLKFEVAVEPGQDLYEEIRTMLLNATERTIRDVESSPMAARVDSVRGSGSQLDVANARQANEAGKVAAGAQMLP